jgi:hypothetical protein
MKITYENKVDTKQSSTPKINRVDADDMNEIKSVVNTNANINELSTTEQKIGKFGDKDLYRKTIELTNISTNFTYEADSNVEEIFLDFNHTYLYDKYTEDNVNHNNHRFVNSIDFSNVSNLTALKNNSFYAAEMLDNTIIFYIGQSVLSYYNKMILTIEYTKKS